MILQHLNLDAAVQNEGIKEMVFVLQETKNIGTTLTNPNKNQMGLSKHKVNQLRWEIMIVTWLSKDEYHS